MAVYVVENLCVFSEVWLIVNVNIPWQFPLVETVLTDFDHQEAFKLLEIKMPLFLWYSQKITENVWISECGEVT